jgi:hypothetical protein
LEVASAADLSAIMQKFQKDFEEKILERLLALNLERAAEEAAKQEEDKSANARKPRSTRAKHADEMI